MCHVARLNSLTFTIPACGPRRCWIFARERTFSGPQVGIPSPSQAQDCSAGSGNGPPCVGASWTKRKMKLLCTRADRWRLKDFPRPVDSAAGMPQTSRSGTIRMMNDDAPGEGDLPQDRQTSCLAHGLETTSVSSSPALRAGKSSCPEWPGAFPLRLPWLARTSHGQWRRRCRPDRPH